MVTQGIIKLRTMKLPREFLCNMHLQYENIKYFIENDLHVELTFEQKQRLKYMLDADVQKHLQELYEEADT